jgi:hypothetical protein
LASASASFASASIALASASADRETDRRPGSYLLVLPLPNFLEELVDEDVAACSNRCVEIQAASAPRATMLLLAEHTRCRLECCVAIADLSLLSSASVGVSAQRFQLPLRHLLPPEYMYTDRERHRARAADVLIDIVYRHRRPVRLRKIIRIQSFAINEWSYRYRVLIPLQVLFVK